MKRIYTTGLNKNEIHLKVNISTAGISSTVVVLAKSGGQKTIVAESDINSGNVPRTRIEKAEILKGFYLIIHTTINFGALDKNHWIQEARNFRSEYEISGGFSGNQLYNHDNDDVTISFGGKIITITKPIKFE